MQKKSIPSLLGFYFFGILATSMRPEYSLPVVLVTLPLAGHVVWRGAGAIQSRFGPARYWTCGVVLLLVGAGGAAIMGNPPAVLARKAASLDRYALFGLGQCYADFYLREHPGEIFSPMTDYKPLLDRTFNKPEGFLAAMKNNPGEAVRYFVSNAVRNLFTFLPKALLGSYREQSEAEAGGWLRGMVFGVLLAGGLAGTWRLCRARWIWTGLFSRLAQQQGTSPSIGRKLALLLAMLSASAVATVLLVGTPRYFLSWVPLFYLGVAYCADSLLSTVRLARFEAWLVAGAGLCLCSPNYVVPRPNREMDALRRVAPYVRDRPRIAAWWANPDVVFGFSGNAEAVNSADGIMQADIENDRIDILSIDGNLRSTRTWAVQRAFFERFELEPERFGFKKLVGFPSDRFKIYYKQ